MTRHRTLCPFDILRSQGHALAHGIAQHALVRVGRYIRASGLESVGRETERSEELPDRAGIVLDIRLDRREFRSSIGIGDSPRGEIGLHVALCQTAYGYCAVRLAGAHQPIA